MEIWKKMWAVFFFWTQCSNMTVSWAYQKETAVQGDDSEKCKWQRDDTDDCYAVYSMLERLDEIDQLRLDDTCTREDRES